MEGDVQVCSGLAPSSLLARVGISALCFHCLQFGFDIPCWPETVLLPEFKPSNVLSDAFTRTMEGSLFGLKRLSGIRQDQGKFLLIFVLVTRHMISCSTLRCFGPQGPWVWRNTFAPYHIVRRWSPYHHDWCCFLRILAMPSSCLLFIIEEALPIEKGMPIEKGTNDSWYICIAQCTLPLSGCRLWLQTFRNQTKSSLIQNFVFLQKQKAPECKIGSSAGFTWLLSHTEVVPTMQQSKNSKFLKQIEITV